MAKSLKPLIARINHFLVLHLREYRGGLEESHGHERVLGFVVSASFDRMDHPERQEKLRRLLEAGLEPEELLLLGPIVTMTPREADVGRRAG